MLRLDCFEVGPTVLLSKCLPKNSLVALIAILLALNVVQCFTITLLAEECLVLILFLKVLLLNLDELALRLFPNLISHGHGQVLLPELELSL